MIEEKRFRYIAVMIMTVMCMLLQMLDVSIMPAWAAVTDVVVDDFSGSNYTVGSVMSSSTGWNGNFASASGSSTPSGEPDTAIVRSTNLLPSGRVVENRNNGTTSVLCLTKTLPANSVSLNTASQYYFKWNVYLGADVAANSGMGTLLKLMSSGSANGNNRTGAASGGTLQIGMVYNAAATAAAGGTKMLSPIIYQSAALKGTNTNIAFACGKMYTLIAHIIANTSGSDYAELKIYEYGTDEPNAYTLPNVDIGALTVVLPYMTLTATTSSTVSAADTSIYPEGSVKFGQLEFRSYTGADISNANTVFSDEAALNPDFSNINAAGSLASRIAYTGASTVTWASSDPDYINIVDGMPNVLKGPSSGTVQMCLTATLTKGASVTKKAFPVTVLSGITALPVLSQVKINTPFVMKDAPALGSYTLVDPVAPADDHSTFQWYSCEGSNGSNMQEIQNANNISYIPTSAESGKYIVLQVTPKIASPSGGNDLIGQPALSDIKYVYPDLNPIAVNPTIQAEGEFGKVLRGICTFEDPSGVNVNQSIYKWYYVTNGIYQEIESARNQQTYEIQTGDVGKSIVFEVTPVNELGYIGTTQRSPVYVVELNPVINGDVNIDSTRINDTSIRLTAGYRFTDPLNCVNASVYQWEVSDLLILPFTPVAGAVSNTFNPPLNLDSKYIRLKVTPVTSDGRTGTPVTSQPVKLQINKVPDIIIDELDRQGMDSDGYADENGMTTSNAVSSYYAYEPDTGVISIAADPAGSYVTYKPNIQKDGQYKLYIWVPRTNSDPMITTSQFTNNFAINDGLNSTYTAQEVENYDNESYKSGWLYLGTYVLYCQTQGSTAAFIKKTFTAVNARADAIKLSYVPAVPAAPAASEAKIGGYTGYPMVGNTLKAEYKFEDSNYDHESGSECRWYRSSTNGDNAVFHEVYQGTQYTLTEADLNQYLYFAITPCTEEEPKTGEPVSSDKIVVRSSTGGVRATDVRISGEAKPGQRLEGDYTFVSDSGDVDYGSTFQWLISDSGEGVYSPIAGATGKAYIVSDADIGKFIKFEIVPKSNFGEGEAARSPYVSIQRNTQSTIKGSPGGGGGGGSSIGTGTWSQPVADPVPVSAAPGFDDIQGHWAKKTIEEMAPYLNGTGDHKFEPDNDITRAEFTAILVRVLKLNQTSYHGGFNDVTAQDWYANVLQTAEDNGLVSGSDGYFRPDLPITRQEMTQIVIAAYKKLNGHIEEADLSQFSDAANISDWAKESVAAAVNAGLILGMENNQFEPMSNATRAQAAVIIKRLIDTGLVEVH